MKIKCYSIRLKSLIPISSKCHKAIAFDGTSALVPSSQYFGIDQDVSKTEAHWISAWILERIKLQHSKKKAAWFDKKTFEKLPLVIRERNVPQKKHASKIDPDQSLLK